MSPKKLFGYSLVFTLALSLTLSGASATQFSLIKDINEGAADAFEPDYITMNTNNLAYFIADDGIHGMELWKTDGTEEGTTIVKDIVPGANGSYPYFYGTAGNLLFFAAEFELWRSDGSDAGTFPIADNLDQFSWFTDFNGVLFFQASNGITGRELWKSDGTSEGTTLVKDTDAGASHGNPGYLTVVNDTLYFQASSLNEGIELWKSDGSPEGTTLVKDIYPGNQMSNPSYLTAVGNTLFFSADDGGGAGQQLWKSDGTEEGTIMVKSIPGGGWEGEAAPEKLTAVNGTLFFFIYGLENRELWKSDGSEEGTVKVADGTFSEISDKHAAVGNSFFFFADVIDDSMELWKSDGTELGTVLVKTILSSDPSSVYPDHLRVLNDILYFSVGNESGSELWQSDGTEEGTKKIEGAFAPSSEIELNEGDIEFTPSSLLAHAEKLLFIGSDNVYGKELWSYTPNNAPVISNLTVTPANNTTGNIDIAVTVNDEDGQDLTLSYWYEVGECTPYQPDFAGTDAIPVQPATYASGTIEIVNYAGLPGNNHGIWIGDNPIREGTHWFAAVSNENTATSIETAINTLEGWNFVSANAEGSIVTVSAIEAGTTGNDIYFDTSVFNGDLIISDGWSLTGGSDEIPAIDAVPPHVSTQLVSSIISASDSSGSLDIVENQAVAISTLQSDNTVVATWSPTSDELTPNTQHCVHVFANDSIADSEVLSAQVILNPAQPTNITATANGQSSIILEWDANGNPEETEYGIYSITTEEVLSTTTDTSFTVTGLTPSSSHSFTIRAIQNGNSEVYIASAETESVTTAALSQIVTIELKSGNGETSFQFSGSATTHTARVESINLDDPENPKAVLTIQSDPVTVTLGAGESQNIDTSGNGTNDTTVTVNSIDTDSSSVNFTLTAIAQTSSSGGGGGFLSLFQPQSSSTDDQTDLKTIFNDTAGHWGEQYIQTLLEKGIIQGYQDGNFKPDAPVTRAELLKMIMEAYEINQTTVDTASFSDVSLETWYGPYIETAKTLDFISGYSDGTFKPNNAVNRAEALAMILNSSGLDLLHNETATFTDTQSSDWYAAFISYAVENNIIQGYQNGNFGPSDNLTRAQAAKIIVLALELTK